MKINKLKVLKFIALPAFLGYGVLANLNCTFSLTIFCGFVVVTALQFMYITD